MSTYCECGHVYGCRVASYFHEAGCKCAECTGGEPDVLGDCLAQEGCDCEEFIETFENLNKGWS